MSKLVHKIAYLCTWVELCKELIHENTTIIPTSTNVSNSKTPFLCIEEWGREMFWKWDETNKVRWDEMKLFFLFLMVVGTPLFFLILEIRWEHNKVKWNLSLCLQWPSFLVRLDNQKTPFKIVRSYYIQLIPNVVAWVSSILFNILVSWIIKTSKYSHVVKFSICSW